MESSPPRFPTRAALPVAPYIGGKRRLAQAIIERLAVIPHETYVEPFIGMGGVFLRRPFRATCEVINDINREVVTLFRVLQRHYVALMDMLRWQLTSRSEFERLSATAPDTLTDLERAARFLYLQRTAFGGKVAGQNFGVVIGSSARFDITKLGSLLEDVHERLSGVVIERLPYADLLARYDRPSTLFYLDPPYLGSEGDYGADVFGRGDYRRLADALGTLQGRFVLSLNDNPEVREIFGQFQLEAIETVYSVGGRSSTLHAPELLITPRGMARKLLDQLALFDKGG